MDGRSIKKDPGNYGEELLKFLHTKIRLEIQKVGYIDTNPLLLLLLLLLLLTAREYLGMLKFHRMNSERQKLTQKMYNSGQFRQHWKYELGFACLRPASFLFSQFSTAKFSTFPSSTLTCCFLRKRFQLCPTRRVHFWFPFISLSFLFYQAATGGYAMWTGYVQALYFLLKLSTKRLDAFSNNEKKTSGLSSCFDFSRKNVLLLRGGTHALYLTLPPQSTFHTSLFLPSPNRRRRGDIGWLDLDDGNGGDGGGDHVVGDGDDDGEDDGDWGACHDGGASSLFVLCLAVLCTV